MTQPGGDTARGRLGRRGEDIAARFLADAGYRIVERNWRCSRGEIDIIAQQSQWLVFVEVKTRSSLNYGHPLESITMAKLARLRSLAMEWCTAHPQAIGQVRIDAVAVVAPERAPYTLEHLTGVFS